MTEKDLKKIGVKTTFREVMENLQLTDRQNTIFMLRYGRGWCISDIAAEIGNCTKVVSDELNIIRHKMAQLD